MPHRSDMHLRQTRRFINENPTSVVVKRRKRTSDGQGGYVFSAVDHADTRTIEGQTVRLVNRGNLSDADAVVTSDGETVIPKWIVIGIPEEVSLLQNDILVFPGNRRMRIVMVEQNPEWRISAQVVEFRG